MSQATMHTSSLLSKDAFQVCARMVRRSAVLWCGLKPNCLLEIMQLIVEQVALKLLVDHSFHHLANDAQQGNWPWNLSCGLG